MIFDRILPVLRTVFMRHNEALKPYKPILINRDLNAKVRLIVSEDYEEGNGRSALEALATDIFQELGPKHAYPVNQALLFEENIEKECKNGQPFELDSVLSDVYVIDRLVTSTNWSHIAPVSSLATRTVFFSIKGGVGRSSALAATAWSLAESGKKVMVLDLDLESPGLSSSLLPTERRPKFGICDWLVEDLTGNSDIIFDDMVASSPLSHNGEILVVPAHGDDPGEYIAKLGRVWMSTLGVDGRIITWSERLASMLDKLEERWRPDVVLIDSRAGIDEVASACLTELGATNILLFAISGDQTWSGYRILFKHWHTTGVIREIRERLQLVGAMLPELNTEEYFRDLREDAWNLFSDEIYDELPAGDNSGWSFDAVDESAPHHPLAIRWHRSFSGLRTLHGRFNEIDRDEVMRIFGPVVDFLMTDGDEGDI